MIFLKSIVIPQDSVNDHEVKIVVCACSHGDKIRKGQLILEYETSKSVISIESDLDGYVVYNCEEGQIVNVGSEVAGILDEWDENLLIDWKLGGDSINKKNTSLMAECDELRDGHVVQYSVRAEEMIRQFNVSKSLFSRYDFVTIDDVREILNKNTNSLKLDNLYNQRRLITSPSAISRVTKKRLVIVCANHISNEMICDIVSDQDNYDIVGYVVDKEYQANSPTPVLDTDVFQFPEKIAATEYDAVVIAMGGSLSSMQFRSKVFNHYSKCNIPFVNLISSSAKIANNVIIGSGNIIESNVYIGPGTVIGDNNFISYSTTIGHHNEIGNCNLFAPGVMMAGLVTVGNNCIFPTGVNFIDKVSIGNQVIFPVGYNVISDVPDETIIKNKN